MKPLFCPVCHKPVEVPEFVKENQHSIKTEKGVKVECPHCKRGKVKYAP
jgi:endogenous inhibitor of DNA gyrase (YacG/DUF329 family)